jgi:arylsulfatase A-like enzyme
VSLPPDLKPDGEDMSDVLLGHPRPRTTLLLWEWRFRILGEVFHQSPMLAIREGNWKLLINPDHTRLELYDIPRDPTELNNVANQYPEAVEALSAKVLAWQKQLPEGPVDPGAGKNDYLWPGMPKPTRQTAR